MRSVFERIRKLVKTMKRIREVTIITLILLFVAGVFAEYAVTASAPGIRAEVEISQIQPAERSSRGKYVGQLIRSSSLFIKDEITATEPTIFAGEHASLNGPPSETEVVDPLASGTPEPVVNLGTGATSAQPQPKPKPDGNYCDPSFVGSPISFSQTTELTLEELISQIHNRFAINFLMGPNLRHLPINIKTDPIPWNVLLKSQLFVSGVRARCVNPNTIELVQNSDLPKLQDTADVTTKFVKLKFLQRTSSGTVDLAGRSSGQNGGGGSCGSGGSGSGQVTGSSGGGGFGNQNGETAAQLESSRFDKLIIEIEKILGIRSMTESAAFSSGGGGGGGQTLNGTSTEERRTNRFVTQIPGRNILVIRATEEEHALIDEIIKRADRPPFQVVVKGLVYTANQQRIFDLGVQTNIVGGIPGSLSSPPTTDSSGTPTVPGSPTHGTVFGHTAGNVGTLFDFSALVGSFNFQVQANAFEQNGVISIKSRPFSTVLDGLCTTLDVGPSLPIVIDSTLGGQGSITFVNAANNLSVTPYVVDDDSGNPIAVTLDVRVTANDVDQSNVTQGIPAITQRSIQTQLLLGFDKTAILGGFTVDSDQKSVSRTPGLSYIPLLGELFKRRTQNTQINRLYFALSAEVIPYGQAIEPVVVPGASTQPPSLTPKQLDRSNKAEPKQVVTPKTDH